MTSATEPAWQQPQEFTDATPADVREELGDLIKRSLLGPWGEDDEELALYSRGPRDEYLVGALGPRRIITSSGSTLINGADQLGDTTEGGDVGADDAEADLPEVLSPQTLGRIWASSMGMSFAVDDSTDLLSVEVSWGDYVQRLRETEHGPKPGWQRVQARHEIEIDLTRGRYQEWLRGEAGEVHGVWLEIVVHSEPGRRIVRLALVNGQAEEVTPHEAAWMFQTRLAVRAMDGYKAVFFTIGDPLDGIDAQLDSEDTHLELLYSNAVRHAFGHNVAVTAQVRPQERNAWRLSTTWLPTHEVPQVTAKSEMSGLVTSMDRLVKLAQAEEPAELVAGLIPMVDGYKAWLDQQEHQAAVLHPGLREAGQRAVADARAVSQRISAGIRLLRESPQARLAFGFANEAMALQRRNTEAAAIRRRTGVSYSEAFGGLAQDESRASWRPFQLGFVLLNLAALTNPGHQERGDRVDLLFFPTGGGKTEAYLGLAAYTFAIRRLQGKVGDGGGERDGGDGVAVLMRYTLRMLTAQQFQRAAALVCAAEKLRQDAPETWGTEPFRIGLWVGRSVSPNWYTDDSQNVAEARDSAGKTRSLQILACPWCGAELKGHRDQKDEPGQRMVITYCPEGEGADACLFSERLAKGRGLPVLTVDEYLYRMPPSLLVATVDKLAQLPWYGYAGMLFGRVSQRCPVHGYRHPDLDTRISCGSWHRGKGGKILSQEVSHLRPPDLIIQDELHLISDALGTTVGLFENAVDELCSWEVDGRRTGPKIIASTATTKRAPEQIRQLYARGLAIFPPQVLDSGDTFFSEAVPVSSSKPGRRYMGICAHGWRMKAAEIRLAEILLVAGQTLFNKYGKPADPYMTVVGYFNATRELAGMRRYLDDDVVNRVRRADRGRGLAGRALPVGLLNIEELTSRINSTDITGVLERVAEPFDPERHTSLRQRQYRAETKSAKEAKRAPNVPDNWRRPGVDVVLATSMLQVGVDVSRFGLMVVTGQPKNTAEYIQATSRVGRDTGNDKNPARPGLVITLYNWSRPRDLAHYEDFAHYHETFYRRVEALSVTPYSRRSIDRGTAATFIATVRNSSESWSVNANAQHVDLTGDIVEGIVTRMVSRAGRAAGDQGASYLAERIAHLRDKWAGERRASAQQGYETKKEGNQQLVGLIKPAGEGPWSDLTVGRSMRETENEINLLIPGTGLYDPIPNTPEWNFGPDCTDASDDTLEDSSLEQESAQ